MHMVSKRDLTLPSWRPWGCRGILRRWWQPIQRKNDSVCQSGKLYLSKLFLEETPAVLSLETLCEKIMGMHITGRAVKNHISSEMASELIAIYRTYVPFVVRGSSAISSPLALSLLLSSSTPLITLCPKEKGEDGQRRGAKPEKKRRFLSKNWIFSLNVMLLEETTAVLSFGKLCEVWKRTHSHVTFSRVCMHLITVAHMTLDQDGWPHHAIHCFMCSVWFGPLSSTLHFALFTVPLIFFVILLIFIFIFHVGRVHASPTRIMGKLTTRPAVKNHISSKMARTSVCNISHFVPLVVPCINEFFYVIYTYLFNICIAGFWSTRKISPAERSGSVIEEWRWNPLHKPVGKGEHKTKMKTTKKYKAIYWKTCRRFWNQFKGYDSPGLRYDKRVSGNPKDHHCAKCQKSSTGKSLRYEIWGQVPWREREWQQRCVSN